MTARLLLLVFAVLLGVGGCVQRVAAPPPQATPSVVGDLLGPNDVFEVRVLDEEGLSGDFRVGEDGTIVYPVLGRLPVAGRTANQLAEELTALLADGYLKHPQVAVFVREYNSSKVAVIGQVKAPGRYPYRSDMTIVQAIAEAGGMTDRAVQTTVVVTRREGDDEASYDVPFRDITLGRARDFRLVPGDVIVVAESAVK